ncbi:MULTISPECIES: NAD(+) diphosphatase [Vibrio]|uniref:NAD-capped RNA hydrolase NudC n=1 Tax=Vibrio mediterranei TaxID=689 RepID=A0A3G4VDZ7_9VIBR|nr:MULTISPECIES: NAD(+) diphosphatase [Vibrio]AYV23046.1 NAD(+) diphosphatase [Vibrio mediterranei]MCF4176811.1 NAD(+) diphosphatase [Vibrio sp. McD22-P3]MCG9659511.1 NAD(+) diphosphatase [Vibrio mediterranei]MCY9853597.1 NAD(+) diphosphatase [Vibrio mediterranei]MDA0110592.1 NAD(+) diphosphatase [Vibrio sp. La 4.2.2]
MLKKSENHIHQAYWCVVSGNELWLVDGEVPQGSAEQFQLPAAQAIQVGEFEGTPVMWLNDADLDGERPLTSLRELLHLPEALFYQLSKAIQYGYMSQSMRFCPQCGGRNHLNHNQLAMQCQDCRTLHYPRIFPCIIVAVRKGSQILLAQHNRHAGGMYTVIAGFLEVGETLETCVAREVEEETGIKVGNIRYFGSQPWAFPSSMMMAFLADYESGEIKPDFSELKDAQWFETNALPLVAPEGTIARALINATAEQVK